MRIPSKAAIGSIFVLSGFLPLMVGGQDAAKPQVAAQAEQPSSPSCRYCPNPEYPPEGLKAKIPEATVLLEIVVSKSGDVDGHDIRVLKEDPPGHGFGDKAVGAVKNWKFNPPTLNGKPVKAKTKVEVWFRADQSPFFALHGGLFREQHDVCCMGTPRPAHDLKFNLRVSLQQDEHVLARLKLDEPLTFFAT